MGRPKNQPLPETDENDAETVVEQDENDFGNLDGVMEKLAGQPRSGLDANTVLMMAMMEKSRHSEERARREEKESRSQTWKLVVALIAPVLPILVEKIFGAKNNPMLEKLLEGVMAKGNNTDMIKDMMSFMVTGNQTMLTNAIQQLATVGEVKDRIYQEQLERMKEPAAASNPIIEGMREVRLLLDSAGIKLGKSAPVNPTALANDPTLTDPVPSLPAPDASAVAKPAKAAPIVVLLRMLHLLQSKGSTMSPIQRAKIRGGLVVTVLEDEALTKAILAGDRNAIVAMGEPVVIADKELMAWIVSEGVDEWIMQYLGSQLGPVLDEAVNAEEYAQEKDTDENDENDDTTTPAP